MYEARKHSDVASSGRQEGVGPNAYTPLSNGEITPELRDWCIRSWRKSVGLSQTRNAKPQTHAAPSLKCKRAAVGLTSVGPVTSDQARSLHRLSKALKAHGKARLIYEECLERAER